MNKKVVVIEEDRIAASEIEKAMKKEKRLKSLNKVGNTFTIIASPSLVASILSPFDFEGPIIEIVCAAALVVGVIMKSIARKGLQDEAINTDGKNHTGFSLDQEDASKVGEIIKSYSTKKEPQLKK